VLIGELACHGDRASKKNKRRREREKREEEDAYTQTKPGKGLTPAGKEGGERPVGKPKRIRCLFDPKKKASRSQNNAEKKYHRQNQG